MAVRGVDVSDHQGTINWSRVRGIQFAATKATEGLTFKAHTFKHNWDGIKAAGLVRLAYHFGHADPGRSPEKEAHEFLAYVKRNGGWRPQDIPVLDIEAGSLSGSALTNWCDRWCAVVEREWRPGFIYSGNWFAGAKRASFAGPKNRGWKLWLAAYVNNPNPFVHGGYKNWTVWQHTDGIFGPTPHSVEGIGKCDVNVFNGTTAELRAVAAGPKPRKYASRVLRQGDTGADVQALQLYLRKLVAPKLVADGIYGKATETAKLDAMWKLGWPLDAIKKREQDRSIGKPGLLVFKTPANRSAAYKATEKQRVGKPRK